MFVLIVLMLCGCSSTNNSESSDVTRTLGFSDFKIDVEDEEAVGADIEKTVDNETVSRSQDILKGNMTYADFMNYVYDILENPIPDEAQFPAVKYIEGEWTYCLLAEEEYANMDYVEIGYGEISLDYQKESMTIELHPRIGHADEELYPLTDEDAGYLPFVGGRTDEGGFCLDDNDGLIFYVDYYYAHSGREFVEGYIYFSEENFVRVLFFRGQQ